MNNETLLKNLRNVPDFPIPGIQFKDVSTLFKSAECLQIIVEELYNIYKDKGITKVVGIESRGFVIGAALALKLGAGFIMCRKPGKLPADTLKESYMKEYGEDTIEIHSDAIDEKDIVLLHDDLLATGGSMKAAYNLVQKFAPQKTYINFIIELTIEGLNGRNAFNKEIEMTTLLKIEE
jgi:adenine phosphoribosyltransferase